MHSSDLQIYLCVGSLHQLHCNHHDSRSATTMLPSGMHCKCAAHRRHMQHTQHIHDPALCMSHVPAAGA